jgi:hypothetical protein
MTRRRWYWFIREPFFSKCGASTDVPPAPIQVACHVWATLRAAPFRNEEFACFPPYFNSFSLGEF